MAPLFKKDRNIVKIRLVSILAVISKVFGRKLQKTNSVLYYQKSLSTTLAIEKVLYTTGINFNDKEMEKNYR